LIYTLIERGEYVVVVVILAIQSRP